LYFKPSAGPRTYYGCKRILALNSRPQDPQPEKTAFAVGESGFFGSIKNNFQNTAILLDKI